MAIILKLNSESLDLDALQDLTRRLRNDLQEFPNLNPTIPTLGGLPEEKGKVSEFGKIMIGYIKEGAIPFIVDSLSTYFKRDSTLIVEVEKDGRSVKFSAKNMDSEQLDKTRDLIKEILE